MIRISLLFASAAAVLSLTSGRVANTGASSPRDINTVLELLNRADPSENDIFAETMLELEAPPRLDARPSPTQHILETLSRPRYIDASEFRSQGTLPPALDINRQLTLLSASKMIRPPVDIVHQKDELSPDELDKTFYNNSSPLFRDDFPSDSIDYILEPLESDVASDDKPEPRFSTSVSVSTSVSFSNGSSLSSETLSSTSSPVSPTAGAVTASTPTSTQSATTSPAITTTPSSSPATTTDLSTEEPQAESLALVSDYEDPPYVVAGEYAPTYISGDTFRVAGASEYPVDEALSPLSHILAGFGGELGPFGGDVRGDAFIRGFRPDGF